jgi:hypothetical protein
MPDLEPIAASAAAPSPAVVPEPPAAVMPAVEPAAATPEPVPPQRSAVDRVETPVWQIVAPDPEPQARPQPPTDTTPQPQWPLQQAPSAPSAPQWPAASAQQQPASHAPEWPTAPVWPTPQGRSARPHAAEAIWAASNRDVLSRPESGVQACINCGLALSATARFCRRCGTSQVHA